MSERKMTVMTPANDWREALPLGDGSFGALVYGGISPETILFNHDSLWYGPEAKPLPDYSAEFYKVREMGFSGDMKGANDYLANRMREDGISGQQTYHPAFDLKLRMPQKEGFSEYRRTLDFSDGEAHVCWKDGDCSFSRDFFISRKDHVAVMRIRADKPFSASFQLCEHNLYDSLDVGGTPHEVSLHFSTRSEDNTLYFNAKGSSRGEYGAVMKLYASKVSSGEERTWTEQLSSLPMLWELPLPSRAVLSVSGETEVILTLGMYVNTDKPEEEELQVKNRLDDLGSDYDTLLRAHKKVHTQLYDRLRLTLQTEHGYKGEETNDLLLLDAYQGKASAQLITKLFDYGRYLLMTCSSETSLPPTLQGIFNGDYFPAWQSFYVHNENTQMFYWQALSGRLPEVTPALYRFFEDRIEDFRTNASHLFGCRGIFIPLVTAANSGLMQDPAPHELSFTGVAAWISAHFYDYYLFTGDLDFLREHAVPFMEETALFYEDYMILDSDGKYTIFPSNSPENAPRNSFPEDTDLSVVMNPGIPTTFNSTVDTALVRELLTNLTAAYGILKIKPEKKKQYTEMLQKLRSFRINSDGALAEWICEKHTDNYAHRHLSHLYPLFPGFQITEEDPALFNAARTAVEKRLEIGLAAQTGWSLVHLANIYARLHDGNSAARCFDLLTRSAVGRNLFTYHNDYRNMGLTLQVIFGRSAPYQIDANMGFTAAVIEMLVSSSPDNVLRIAPALPDTWEKGSISRLNTRCGCEVDLSWNLEKGELYATLFAREDRTIRVILPEGFRFGGENKFLITFEKDKQYQIFATM